jgi:hypothetical protein
VADHMIDARCQTGTAPDERTAMRYPTRESELDHRRLQVLPSPLHDRLINFTLASVEKVPAAPGGELGRGRDDPGWPAVIVLIPATNTIIAY